MLPNLLVIGARKAGTTSLHSYLALHPEISMSDPKEPDFFVGPGSSWDRGLEWYESLFDPAAPVRGEASPTYTAYPYATGVPERVRSVLPDVRLVYVVRDPIERMVSEYAHRLRIGYERRPIEEVLGIDEVEHTDYVVQSRYLMQAERWLEVFPRSRLLVVDLDELNAEPAAAMAEVYAFLGVEAGFSSDRLGRVHNPSRSRPLLRLANRVAGGRVRPRQLYGLPGAARVERALSRPAGHPRLDSALRRRLEGLVARDAAGFRELAGKRFETWSV